MVGLNVLSNIFSAYKLANSKRDMFFSGLGLVEQVGKIHWRRSWECGQGCHLQVDIVL